MNEKNNPQGDLTTWGAAHQATESQVTFPAGSTPSRPPRTPEQRARAIVAWLTQGKARGEAIDAETWVRAITSEIEGAVEAEKTRRTEAITLAVRFGGIDGAHHKAWVIDQMVRVLAGDDYARIVADARSGEDGPETYDWDTGTAP